ncbi:type IV pilin protein [Pseudoxanthomonas kaohsiungensis]|uniref:Type IV pilin protein n=1 Tax=Pseudoxanthomonas kaohsiungensis TaxID=283923 RepID=A0ABW3LS22_9GAMM|nr:type IV pilin protein [Pseudoxanthomonas kaohsiungensis]KAF1703578.1 pilus assembly protein PilE [Pseudoxanthomonas kaohsiungensis]
MDSATTLSGNARRVAGGFTLIELMIVVAVVAILASIAVPSYQEQIRKSRRAQAKADIVEYMQMAERYFTVNNTYVGFTLPVAVSPREAGATARYNLAASTQTATALVLTATALGPQASDRCGNLSVSNTGLKTESGTATLAECW